MTFFEKKVTPVPPSKKLKIFITKLKYSEFYENCHENLRSFIFCAPQNKMREFFVKNYENIAIFTYMCYNHYVSGGIGTAVTDGITQKNQGGKYV